MSLDHWNKAAREYAEGLRAGKDKGRNRYEPAVWELLGNVSGRRVLDAGCGEGYWCRKLALAGALVTGIDGSSEFVRLAMEESIKTEDGESPYILVDLTQPLPFPSDSFDVVLCNMVLMDLPTIDACISEFARVLVSSGEFLFTTTHPCFFTFPWVHNEEGERLYKAVSNYSQERPETLNFWGETIHYHRPLAAYFSALEKAGFVTERVQELQMNDEDRLPSFLAVRAAATSSRHHSFLPAISK